MNIKNNRNESLLWIASSYGTTWIMECVLALGVELDINFVGLSGTALACAVEGENLEMVTLLPRSQCKHQYYICWDFWHRPRGGWKWLGY